MKLIIIFGPPAVGKMTVGQELAKITNLKLFHNHMSLELVNNFFDFGTPNFRRLDKAIRFDIFNELAKSDLEGVIFTMVWALNFKEDENYIDRIVKVFEKKNAEIYFIELKAELKERLVRNKDEHRLKHKPSKRDVSFSEKSLLSFELQYRMNTTTGDLPNKKILTIDNTNLEAAEVAEIIKKHIEIDKPR
jgi:shikimate kinase